MKPPPLGHNQKDLSDYSSNRLVNNFASTYSQHPPHLPQYTSVKGEDVDIRKKGKLICTEKSTTHKSQTLFGNRLKSQPAEIEQVDKPLSSLESLND